MKKDEKELKEACEEWKKSVCEQSAEKKRKMKNRGRSGRIIKLACHELQLAGNNRELTTPKKCLIFSFSFIN